MIFNVMSLSKIISNHLHHIQPDHYIFPYPSLFPWPVPFTGLLFRLHFFFESLASLSVIVVTVGVDSIFTFFVFLMVGQLREISYSITHIDKNSDRNNVAKECVRQYCIVLKCRDNLQKIYGPIILCLMTTNAVVLCLTIYQMTQVWIQLIVYHSNNLLPKLAFNYSIQSFSPLKILLFFTYISLKLIQTYMYSWCGTHLTTESEECRNAIYASNWYGDKRFMTAITIMLQQKPLILTACNFTTVSIDMFTKSL
ncbi:odorant receptor 47a-like [Chelonus insularis]|uniref:odorant receptor 47a-like n=1 Tax=Chelonus insularis TaxID=460826 RepID=UPI0015886714|nr:odorant receptor 47a-like [Chelonus insularis]